MAKIMITGAGSAQSNGVINSLLSTGESDEIIGLGSDSMDLFMSRAHKKYLIPHSLDSDYKNKLLRVVEIERPDMIHFQHDIELWVAMEFRHELENLGVNMLIPDNQTIDTCVHKYKSWQRFKQADIKVAENLLINDKNDLIKALKELSNSDGAIWLRSTDIGGGGKGSLPVSDLEQAVEWVDRCKGWGKFVAAEMLTSQSVTALSIWHEGELIVMQSRLRHGWAHSALSPSGVTGVTKVGETFSDAMVDNIAIRSVRAVSERPHGIYGVDMTYDKSGIPNPTEINISRFFTTIEFFTQAGLNMPLILRNLTVDRLRPKQIGLINPLPPGLLWLRAMDCPPCLTTREAIEKKLLKV